MKINYTVNKLLLKQWLESTPERDGETPRIQLMKSAKISSSTLDKALCGVAPGRQIRALLAIATGIEEEELFPSRKEAA